MQVVCNSKEMGTWRFGVVSYGIAVSKLGRRTGACLVPSQFDLRLTLRRSSLIIASKMPFTVSMLASASRLVYTSRVRILQLSPRHRARLTFSSDLDNGHNLVSRHFSVLAYRRALDAPPWWSPRREPKDRWAIATADSPTPLSYLRSVISSWAEKHRSFSPCAPMASRVRSRTGQLLHVLPVNWLSIRFDKPRLRSATSYTVAWQLIPYIHGPLNRFPGRYGVPPWTAPRRRPP